MAREFPISRMRNFGIVAHVDAGKTTTSERVLFYTGMSHKIGEVHDGATVTDWMEQERERGITITAAAISCNWSKSEVVDRKDRSQMYNFNIIDTPGHIDFTAEVKRSMRVLDGAVVVFDSVAGVEPQSETNWGYADEAGVPRICFINKMDRLGASFEKSYASILDRLSKKAVRIQLPWGAEEKLQGVIDLVKMKAFVFEGEMGMTVREVEIPGELQADAEMYRAEMIEKVVEHDDVLMEAYLGGELPTNEQIKATMRKAVLANELFPVMTGSALKNIGVQLVLDARSRVPDQPESPAQALPRRPPAADSEPRLVLAREIAAWIYFLGLVGGVVLLGFWIAIPLFLVSFLRREAKAGWPLSLGLGLGVSAALYVVFVLGLRVALHDGLLLQWLRGTGGI